MFSRTILIPAWVFVVFLAHFSQGSPNATEGDNSTTESTPTPPTGTISSGGIIPFVLNQTEPAYVVEEKNGHPCLLAAFNITIRVSYDVDKEKQEGPYHAFRDVVVPLDASTQKVGVCSANQASLVLEWGNSTFNLNMTFITHGPMKNMAPTNWTLDTIVFGYNLSNHEEFPGSESDDYVSLFENDLSMFNTWIGYTKECDKDTPFELGDDDERGVDFTFHYVRFAAFNLTDETFPKQVDYCIVKSTSNREEDIMVPLIIACSLSLVIVIVVVAYAISRKIQESRDQTQYKPMP